MNLARTCVVALLALLAAGCSPEYNWREVVVGDDVGLVLFPDKPRTESRTLDFAGHDVRFSLTTAEIGRTVFAVGSAPWPQPMLDDESLRQNMGKTVIASMYRNLGHEAPAELPGFGQPFELEGGAGSATRLQARVWLSERGLVEGMVMGPIEGFPEAAAKEFLESVAKGR